VAISTNLELTGQFKIGRNRHKVSGYRAFIACRSEQPGAGAAGIGQRFEGGECLAGNDEQGCARVEPGK